MFKRIKTITFFLALCILILLAGCQSKSALNLSTAQTASILDYQLSDMDKVKVKKDIIYDDYNKLKSDIYYPLGKSDSSKAPTVILIHGIANDDNLKDSMVYQSWGKVIAASGFTAVTFNWRSNLSSSKDVSSLISYMRDNAKTLKINSDDIYVFAFSAGVTQGINDAMRINTGFIKKVIAYYGYIDESILTVNPSIKLPSFFIAMGQQDASFPPDMNDSFIDKAKSAGCKVIKVVHPRGGHGFELVNDEGTKGIIDKTLKFIWDDSNVQKQ